MAYKKMGRWQLRRTRRNAALKRWSEMPPEQKSAIGRKRRAHRKPTQKQIAPPSLDSGFDFGA